MTRKECVPDELARWIIENFPRMRTYKDPFKVLVSTILSQRTRDENTLSASKKLFSVYPDAKSLAAADPRSLYELIKASGMYRQKAERIVNCARIIINEYDGRVPDSLEELTSLPGVGRKTANIVLYVSFSKAALAVDTHVHRISNRLGWVHTKNPDDTEFALMKVLSKELWGPVNGSMVEFGRRICQPISPRCELCGLKDCCQYYSSLKASR